MTIEEKKEIIKFLKEKCEEATKNFGDESKEVLFIKTAIEAVDAKKTKFQSTINEIKKYFSYHLCPDQYVCKIKDIQNDYFKTKKRQLVFDVNTSELIKGNIPEGNNFLLFVLESAHQKEFNKDHTVIAPAWGNEVGDAGYDIREYVLEIFGKGYEDYHLILMNAITFQCSLGCKPEKYFRNGVFRRFWEKQGRSDFQKRFEQIFEQLRVKSTVIVNACTAMNGQKKNIQTIMENIAGFVLELDHPSYNWHAKREIQMAKVNNANLYIGKTPEK